MSGSSRCIVVMYHYVRDRAGTPDAPVRGLSPAQFERQLDRLCDEFHPVDWQAFRRWLRGDRPFPEWGVLLTFDDGLADHADVVLPILRRRGIRGVFFVQGEVLRTGRTAHHHQCHLLSCRLGDDEFARAVWRWLAHSSPGADWPSDVDPVRAQRVYHYEPPARARFKYLLTHVLPIPLRRRMLEELFIEYVGRPAEWARQWYLSRPQLDELTASGHTIGGHGFAHEFYSRLTDEEQSEDIARTAAALRTLAVPGPWPFSYPYGSFTRATARHCAAAGFLHGFATRRAWVRPRTDRYALPRVDTIHLGAFLETELAWQRQ